jgi:hypothetical protein
LCTDVVASQREATAWSTRPPLASKQMPPASKTSLLGQRWGGELYGPAWWQWPWDHHRDQVRRRSSGGGLGDQVRAVGLAVVNLTWIFTSQAVVVVGGGLGLVGAMLLEPISEWWPTWPAAASRADRGRAGGAGRRRGPDRRCGMVSCVWTRSCWPVDLRARVRAMTGCAPVGRVAAAIGRFANKPAGVFVSSSGPDLRLTNRRRGAEPAGRSDGVPDITLRS